MTCIKLDLPKCLNDVSTKSIDFFGGTLWENPPNIAILPSKSPFLGVFPVQSGRLLNLNFVMILEYLNFGAKIFYLGAHIFIFGQHFNPNIEFFLEKNSS